MIDALKQKLDYLLWQAKLREASRVEAFFIRLVRTLYGAFRDVSKGLLSLRAMGLVYTTLLSLVPLLAVSVSVLKGFGVHNQLEPFLINILQHLGDKRYEVTEQILGFVDNMKLGALGSIGLLFLFVTVVSLVMKIEAAFNYTWRISTARRIVQRFSNYLSVILIGPVLLFVATSIATSMRSNTITEKLLTMEPFGSLLLILGKGLPLFLTIISFTLVYALIPNTRVRFTSALYGATIAAVAWKGVGMLFTMFIVNSTNYTAIYSGFAILIIFMIWIYVSWLIILSGASVSYYHQNPEQISDSSQVIRLSCRLREKLALSLMYLIGSNFHHDEPSWSLKALAKHTRMSESSLRLVLSSLAKHHIVTPAGKDGTRYLPARSLEKINLSQIIDAARQAEETASLHPDDIVIDDVVCETFDQIERSIHDASSDQTLLDMIVASEQTAATRAA